MIRKSAASRRKFFELAGQEFNISSTKQLAEVLFEKLRLPVVKKTKTGYSTDIEVLEKLEGKHPVIPYIVEYRALTKLKGTYIDGLTGMIRNGVIHTTFCRRQPRRDGCQARNKFAEYTG